jgi:hypothetical protein
MASAIHKSVANLKKKLGEIKDPKVRKGVTDALRGLRKAVEGEIRKISVTAQKISATTKDIVPW